MHRDLKPENIIFVDKNSNQIKIIDFGTSRLVKEGETLAAKMGTPYYIAPEVIKQDYGIECDIWSCGVILYIMLCGYPPFNSSTDMGISIKIMKGVFDFPEEEWKFISSEAKDLIRKMLVLDTKKRFTSN